MLHAMCTGVLTQQHRSVWCGGRTRVRSVLNRIQGHRKVRRRKTRLLCAQSFNWMRGTAARRPALRTASCSLRSASLSQLAHIVGPTCRQLSSTSAAWHDRLSRCSVRRRKRLARALCARARRLPLHVGWRRCLAAVRDQAAGRGARCKRECCWGHAEQDSNPAIRARNAAGDAARSSVTKAVARDTAGTVRCVAAVCPLSAAADRLSDKARGGDG